MALAASDPGMPPEIAQASRGVAALQEGLLSRKTRSVAWLLLHWVETLPAALLDSSPSSPCCPCLPVQAIAVDYTRNHLRSELAWTKVKLVVVSHMASGLRTKLQQAQAERAQAGEMAAGGCMLPACC